jgi:hypothetical protein
MARTTKYDWPDDQKLQALLDEHGTLATAHQLGCPPSSLSNRIRRRGLRRPPESRDPDAPTGNGQADPPPAHRQIRPAAGEAGLELRRRRTEREPNGAARSGGDSPTQEQDSLEHFGSADYQRVRGRSAHGPFQAGNGNEADGSARDPSRRKGAVARLRHVPPPFLRAVAVLGLAAVAGLAALISASNDPTTYQREASFAVRPSDTVPPSAMNDVLGTLAQPDSAVTETIVNMLGSPRLRNLAAHSAGVPARSVGGSGAQYVWTATRRTGSTIIDVRLTGPDDRKLLALQTAAGSEAARLIEDSYPPYRLETLSAPSGPVQVGPKTGRTVGLAVLLGALLGVTLLLVERRLRSSLGQREGLTQAPAQRGSPWER